MKISVCVAVVCAMCLVLFSVPASATVSNARSWVSGAAGDDNNPCTITAPCATFNGAFPKTQAGGEINCLDSGPFGALTITNAITIICGTVESGVMVSSGTGFAVSASSTDIVYLEGIDFEGGNAGSNGVQITSAAAVHIVNCRVRGFTTAGINVSPSSGGVVVDVIDSIIADNPGEGILIKPTGSGAMRGFVDRSRITHNTGDGIFVNANVTSGSVKLTVRDSESSTNGANGIGTFSNASVAQVQIDSATMTDNTTGLGANGAGSIVRFTRSTVFGNGTGVNQTSGGSVLSYGTNAVDGNGTQGAFGTTPQQ